MILERLKELNKFQEFRIYKEKLDEIRIAKALDLCFFGIESCLNTYYVQRLDVMQYFRHIMTLTDRI